MKKFILIIVLSLLVTPVFWADEAKKSEWLCSECNGRGRIFKKCPRCNGTGICKYCKDTGLYKSRTKKKKECSRCKGSGECLRCSGKGKVSKGKCGVCKGEGGKWRDLGLKDLIKQSGGEVATEYAVLSGLLWLARHQNPDGSWGNKAFQQQCQEDTKCSGTGDKSFDIGLTGLALLAFTGANYSPNSKDTYQGICFGDVVSKSAQYLIGVQTGDGSFGSIKGSFMYNQAIATYALAGLVNLMKDKDEGFSSFYDSVQKGVDFILKAQNPGQAWRYTPKCGDNDASVTSWCVNALKTAQECGLDIPHTVWAGVKSHLDEVTDKNYGRVSYMAKGAVGISSQEEYELYTSGKLYISPSLTAIGILIRLFMEEERKSKVIENGLGLLMRDLPTWDTSLRGKIDYYYWFYGSCAMYKYDGPRGNRWKKWNKAMKDVLLEHQKSGQDGCAEGSWEPIDRWSDEAGRVYTTAINVLTLEVYYRLNKKK